jgi:hypothetical protein
LIVENGGCPESPDKATDDPVPVWPTIVMCMDITY